MIPGVQITLVKYAPMGDPMELRLHGYELTLRLADAEQIEIEEVQRAGAEHEASKAGKGGRLKESGRFTDHPVLVRVANTMRRRRSIRFRMGQH